MSCTTVYFAIKKKTSKSFDWKKDDIRSIQEYERRIVGDSEIEEKGILSGIKCRRAL